MIWRSRTWTAVAAIFTVVNVAGAVMAALQGEAVHAAVHAVISLVGAYLVWRLAPWRSESDVESDTVERRPGTVPAPTPPGLTNRLTHLEQAVDAVAIEVERIGEGQRFITRSFVDAEQVSARGSGAAGPARTGLKDADGHERSH